MSSVLLKENIMYRPHVVVQSVKRRKPFNGKVLLQKKKRTQSQPNGEVIQIKFEFPIFFHADM